MAELPKYTLFPHTPPYRSKPPLSSATSREAFWTMVWAWLRRSKRSPKPKYLLSSATANDHSAAVPDSAVTSVTPGDSCRTWGAVAGACPSTRKPSRVILALRPSVVGKAKRTSPARVAGTATRNRISVVDRSMALSTDHASIMSVIPFRLAAPLSLALLAACRAPAPPAAIDPALSARRSEEHTSELQ